MFCSARARIRIGAALRRCHGVTGRAGPPRRPGTSPRACLARGATIRSLSECIGTGLVLAEGGLLSAASPQRGIIAVAAAGGEAGLPVQPVRRQAHPTASGGGYPGQAPLPLSARAALRRRRHADRPSEPGRRKGRSGARRGRSSRGFDAAAGGGRAAGARPGKRGSPRDRASRSRRRSRHGREGRHRPGRRQPTGREDRLSLP
jgi:hypothetical protein